MSRKRIWYSIDVPGKWWAHGHSFPVELDDPLLKKNGGSNVRYAKTVRHVLRIIANCPSGTTVVRFMNIKRKKPRRYVLREFVKR